MWLDFFFRFGQSATFMKTQKMHQNWYFRFENMTTGNPGQRDMKTAALVRKELPLNQPQEILLGHFVYRHSSYTLQDK
jgi:hypothetical protein